MKHLIILLFFLSYLINANGEKRNMHFSNLTVQDGLSQVSVLCMHKDSQGYMWFGTRNGLNKFDGYTFETFYNNPFDSTTIGNNQILSMAEDADQNMWFGTRNGISRYSLRTGKFRSYLSDQKENSGLNHSFVYAVCWDNNNRLWAGTESGLNVYVPESDSFISVDPDGIFTKNPIYSIVKGHEENTIYIGTHFSGLVKLNTNSLKYEICKHKENESSSLSSNNVHAIHLDPYDNLWVGTSDGGLNMQKKGEKGFLRYRKENGLASNNIRTIIQLSDDEILLGTSNGINILNTQSTEISHYNISDSKNGSISHFSVYSALFDTDSQTLWIGTYSGGIDYYNPYEKRFITHIPLINGKITQSMFSQMIEVYPHLYIATEGNGLLEYNLLTESYEFYKPIQEHTSSYASNILKSLYLDGDFIYCGSNNGSIFKFDLKTKQMSLLYKEKNEKRRNNVIYEIQKDKEGNLLVGSIGTNGLLKIDPKGNIQNSFPVQGKDNFTFDNVICFQEIEENKYLIGTRYDGLFCYDFDNHTLKQYKKVQGRPETYIFENQISDICKDSHGNIWLAVAGSGICLFDPYKENISTYGVEEGLPDNNICMILESKDLLWICSSRSISSFNYKEKVFKNYSHTDGINIDEFSPHSGLLASNGNIYISGNNGFVSFKPSDFHPNLSNFPIVLNKLYIDNIEIIPDDKNKILRENLSAQNEIVLRHDQSNITIEYVALSLVSSSKNQYAYKLEGFDNEWNNVNNRRTAYYTNIPPGTYTFKVIGSNHDGIWNKTGTSIKIKVLPPLWNTWWANCFYIILLCIFSYFIYRYLKERNKLKNDIHLKKMEAQAQIKFQEERNQLFTNFSHEMRSPLTLIISPLEDMVDSPEVPETLKERLVLMYNNAKRLLRLVNNLMDFSKKENGSIKLKVDEENIVEFAKEMCLLFSELALSCNICLNFKPQEESIHTWFDRYLMEKVFFNFLSNAIKNTPIGGNIEVRINKIPVREVQKIRPSILTETTDKESTFLLLEIEDSGVGIPPAELEKIFSPFYQVAQNAHSSSGTGLGLSLSKSIVELHHGEVWAENAPVSGAIFRCLLPIGRNNFTEAEICTNDPDNPKNNDFVVDIFRENLIEGNSKDKKYTILIVEDNADMRYYLASNILPKYNVIEASNGLEGLEKAIHYLPDLIISDLMMTKMDGLEMSHKLKQDIRTSHIPIIMVTARTSARDIQIGFESEVDDYITKPFSSTTLLARIDNLLQSREKLKEIYGKRFDLKNIGIEIVSMDEKFMQKLYAVVEEHYSDPEFCLDEFCKEIGMSRANLYRKIKATTNLSPSEFIRNFRLQMASKILKEACLPVSEVYAAVGFSSHSYFSNSFKTLYGISPTKFLQQENKEQKTNIESIN